MLRFGVILSCFVSCAALAQSPLPVPVALHVSYAAYAAGVHLADVEADLGIGPWSYQVNLAYQTTGMVGLFFSGHQFGMVSGTWDGLRASPLRFVSEGAWRGQDRQVDIEYQNGKPAIRKLVPPNDAEREPVPAALQANSIDTLSAFAELIKLVDATGRCENHVRTFDGRRAVEIEGHTAGDEALEPTSRSSFAGRALRCDFSGQMLAGFMSGDDRARDSKPLRGSAWLAPVSAGGPKLPVRMVFETRWFGEATMYLTGISPANDLRVARGK
jgi:hypothetical protein